MHIASNPMSAREHHTKPSPFHVPLAAGLLAIVVFGSSADASVSIALTVDDLTRDASAFVRVTPVGAVSAWEDGRIVTRTRARVDEVALGSVGGTREVEVRTLGGTVGAVRQSVEGEARFTEGAPVYLFVQPIGAAHAAPVVRVVGRAQGELVIHRDASGRETVHAGDVGALVARKVRVPARIPTGKLVAQLEGLDPSTLRSEIARAWGVTHAH